MSTQSRYRKLVKDSERKNYRMPDLDDPVYKKELACIELAKMASTTDDDFLRPTFAPKQSFLNKLFKSKKDSYDAYLVPRIKSIEWLWDKYRPIPWVDADNLGALREWLRILYGEDIANKYDVGKIFVEVQQAANEQYSQDLNQGIHVLQKESWEYIVHILSQKLPRYDEQIIDCSGWESVFRDCDFNYSANLLVTAFSGGILKEDLVVLLDEYMSNPCRETAIRLIEYEPKLEGLFRNSQSSKEFKEMIGVDVSRPKKSLNMLLDEPEFYEYCFCYEPEIRNSLKSALLAKGYSEKLLDEGITEYFSDSL